MLKKTLLSTLSFVFLIAFVNSTTVFSKEDFDRLDGHGASKKRVDVIEWEDNLEIHVYPGGSLAGLALKIDRTKKQPVMVIGYRFTNKPTEQLIRRNILSIPIQDDFRVYQVITEKEFDKIIISNSNLNEPNIAHYQIDPPPTRLYPKDPNEKPERSVASEKKGVFKPAVHQVYEQVEPKAFSYSADDDGAPKKSVEFKSHDPSQPERFIDDNGAIKPHSW